MTLRSIAGSIALGSALALALVAQPALAQPAVALDSAVYVEHVQPGDARVLEPASQLSRGDRVVTVVSWRLTAGMGGFDVTNPMPRGVYYQASASGNEQVSVDGGRTWGRIGQLMIGGRLASPEDVTHVRWHVPASRAVAGRGEIAYSGIVR